MVVTVSVETDGGRAVVVKRGTDDDADRLRREGERLERARHPGVVPLVRSGRTDDGWELRTLHGGRPVATLSALTPAHVGGLAAGIASTLADLHDLGVVHGRLDGTHVLVGEQGRPVLCGLEPGVPPARPDDDVAALGALLVELLGTDDAGEPIPTRRWWGHLAWTGWDRRALLLLADQAAAEPPTCRPTARRLAASIAEVVPGPAHNEVPVGSGAGSEEPADLDPIERLRASAVVGVPASARPSRVLAAAVVGILLLAVVVGAHRWLGADDPRAPTLPDAPPSSGPTEPPPEVRVSAPVAGSVLSARGHRYRVGQAGDEVLVDDWDCDGEPTPALLRPGTGEVFVFPRWIDDGTLTVEPVREVAGAQTLESEVASGACPALSVRTEAGDLVPVLEVAR